MPKPHFLLATLGLVAVATAQESWQRINTPISPSSRSRSGMAYDSDRHVMVLFGGAPVSSGPQLRDTWEYDGANWRMVTNTGPSPRFSAGMAYDPLRHRMVLFGGINSNSSRLPDTWEYDGVSWALRHSVPVNQERYDLAMAFDPVRGQVIRFGGGGAGGEHGDTQAWDGSQWLLLSAGGPSARSLHAMATDSVRNQIVLFGGRGPMGSTAVNHNDTWLWNGSTWLQAFCATVPPVRTGHALAFDAVTAKTIMFGGGFGSSTGDTWAWDGSNWSLRGLANRPPDTNQAPMAYDMARDRVVLFTNSAQTWEYSAPVTQAGTWQTFGNGCLGSAGVPSLESVLGSRPFTGAPFRVRLASLATHPFLLPFGVVGYSATSWQGRALPLDLGVFGIPGCTAWVEGFAFVNLTRNGDRADWTIDIPVWPQLVGTEFWLQGFVLDGGAPAGAAVSNAGHGRIGLR